MSRKRRCGTDGCDCYIGEKNTSGLCKTCYAYTYYWLRKQSVAAISQHKKKIALFMNRLEGITTPRAVNPAQKNRKRKVA